MLNNKYSLPALLELNNQQSYNPSASQSPDPKKKGSQRPESVIQKKVGLSPTNQMASDYSKPKTSASSRINAKHQVYSTEPGSTERALYESQISSRREKVKPLPKLYTGPLHAKVSQKVDQLRNRYTTIYKNLLKDQADGIENQKIQDLVLGSEDLFKSTYSIKYFGVNNDQIGILSRRVPIKMDSRAVSRSQKRTSPSHRDTSPPLLTEEKLRSKSEASQPIIKEFKTFATTANVNTYQTQQDELPSEYYSHVKETEASRVGESSARADDLKYMLGADVAEPFMKPERYSPEGDYPRSAHSHHKQLPTKEITIKESMNNAPNPLPQTNYIVHSYFLPKHMHGKKKDGKRTKNSEPIFDQVVTDQFRANSRNFEAKLDSMPKVKRTYLRNPKLKNEVPRRNTIQDFFTAPEKFRTHEANNLLAKTSKYSYSKLLNLMSSGETPEEKIVYNTKALHKIMNEKIPTLQKEDNKDYFPANTTRENYTRYSEMSKTQRYGNYKLTTKTKEHTELFKLFNKIRTNIDEVGSQTYR